MTMTDQQDGDALYTTEHRASTENRLKRLQQQVRASLPSLLVQRFHGSFTLHEESVPPEAAYRIQVMIYPQDPFVGEAEIRHMSADDLRPGLMNDRFQIEDDTGVIAQPDENGNYLFAPGSREFNQVNAFYYATLTLRMYERYARRPIPWSFNAPRLRVNPHTGSDANAFYNEQERLLGFHTFTPTNGDAPLSTAESADIVSHEAGHAVLDGIRDLFNESFGLGTTAFHESFGDMTAVLIALHDDSLLRRMLTWTNNDLRMTNFISSIAEQLTDALARERERTLGHTIYLRNALNMLTALPFDALVPDPPEPQFRLGRQPHNYSRLFTGAFYDALVGVYDWLREDVEPHIALSRARDVMGRLLITAVECGPVGELTFHDMALAFLAADYLLFDGEYGTTLAEVFAQRGLGTTTQFADFQASLQALPEIILPDTINTSLAAALFLEQTLIPALKLPTDVEFSPLMTYRNADGYAFMTYYMREQITLDGPTYGLYDGAKLDLYGGLALAFAPDNRLRSAIYRPVLAEDIRQTRIMVQDLIKETVVTGQQMDKISFPQALLLPDIDQPGDEKLVKYPATVDVVKRLGNFVDYVRHLAARK